MQPLDRPQHSQRQLVTDVIPHPDTNGWLPRTSLLDQLQNAAAAAATRALVSAVFQLEINHLFMNAFHILESLFLAHRLPLTYPTLYFKN